MSKLLKLLVFPVLVSSCGTTIEQPFHNYHEIKDQIIPFISGKTNIHNSAFKVYVIDKIPRNEYGKVKFAVLEEIVGNR